ncbi:MAG: hypothetical protein JJU45_17210 [Acidimicrobiia bacterium]|nr:hypothetical protein [Acidimicrobiia bacterium]
MDDQPSGDDTPAPRRRPAGTSDELVEALGTASEAMEYVERARGHLYEAHQLLGRADLLWGDAADELAEAGFAEDAERVRTEVVGRNILDGRWTFQMVEEFDDIYWAPVRAELRRLEAEHMGGKRHVFESEMKERRRTSGRAGHEGRPPDVHRSDVVEITHDGPKETS